MAFRKAVHVLALAGFLSCSAIPTDVDVDRVKKTFLALRFQTVASPEHVPLKDLEIFQLACKQVGVRCSHVLERLKATDPDFYARLNQK